MQQNYTIYFSTYCGFLSLFLFFYTMNKLKYPLPLRSEKPRQNGLTMMMDKGLSIRQVEDFLGINAPFTDLVKLGFGTSLITSDVKDKVRCYQECNIKVFAGGTLFEAFAIRNQIEDYKFFLNKIGIGLVEISDGSMQIHHDKKCQWITEFTKDFEVISEVGSKDENVELSNEDWIICMQKELSAGSWKVIAEAREGGNVGICTENKKIKSDLIQQISSQINTSDIIWESPEKNQQVWFLQQFGNTVNLGNIAPHDVIPLECLRLGLRGDTFNLFL